MYISSVDSGNLAGHLLTLTPGLLALPDQKILAIAFLTGSATRWGFSKMLSEKPFRQLAQCQQ